MLKFASSDDGVHVLIWNILSEIKKIKNKGIQFTFWWATHSVCIRYKSSTRICSDSLFALILDAIWSPWGEKRTLFMVTIFVRPEGE